MTTIKMRFNCRAFLQLLVILSFIAGGISIGLGAAGVTPSKEGQVPPAIIAGIAILLAAGGVGFMVTIESSHPALARTTVIVSPIPPKVEHVAVNVQPPSTLPSFKPVSPLAAAATNKSNRKISAK
jgi:hypothetical protein